MLTTDSVGVRPRAPATHALVDLAAAIDGAGLGTLARTRELRADGSLGRGPLDAEIAAALSSSGRVRSRAAGKAAELIAVHGAGALAASGLSANDGLRPASSLFARVAVGLRAPSPDIGAGQHTSDSRPSRVAGQAAALQDRGINFLRLIDARVDDVFGDLDKGDRAGAADLLKSAAARALGAMAAQFSPFGRGGDTGARLLAEFALGAVGIATPGRSAGIAANETGYSVQAIRAVRALTAPLMGGADIASRFLGQRASARPRTIGGRPYLELPPPALQVAHLALALTVLGRLAGHGEWRGDTSAAAFDAAMHAGGADAVLNRLSAAHTPSTAGSLDAQYARAASDFLFLSTVQDALRPGAVRRAMTRGGEPAMPANQRMPATRNARHRLAGIEDDILAGRKVSPERFGAGDLPSAGDDAMGTLAQSEGGKAQAGRVRGARDFSSLIVKVHQSSSAELDSLIGKRAAHDVVQSPSTVSGSRPSSSMLPINEGYEVDGDSGHPSNIGFRTASGPNSGAGAIVYEEQRRPNTERLLLAEHVGENKVMPVDGFGYIPTRDPKREPRTADGYFDGAFANLPDDAIRFDEKGNPKPHAGIDAPAEKGTPVRAAAGGIVHFYPAAPKPKPYWEFGNWAIIEHPNGEFTVYAHLDTLSEGLKKGGIPAGTVIGTVGSTGNAGKPHLHFEVWRGGIDARARSPMPPRGQRAQYRVDPYLWLQEDQWLSTNNDTLDHRPQQ